MAATGKQNMENTATAAAAIKDTTITAAIGSSLSLRFFAPHPDCTREIKAKYK